MAETIGIKRRGKIRLVWVYVVSTIHADCNNNPVVVKVDLLPTSPGDRFYAADER